MFPGSQSYPDSMMPEPSLSMRGTWYAWNETGALSVLDGDACGEAISQAGGLRLLMANGSAVRLGSGGRLHEALSRLAEAHEVEVLPVALGAGFRKWGGRDDPLVVDTIAVRPLRAS